MNPGTAAPATKPESLAPELEEPYRRLLRVLRAGRGMFTLVPVESNLVADERERFFEHLRQDLEAQGMPLYDVQLDYNHWDPVEVIQETLATEIHDDSVLLLRGLERTPPGSPTLHGFTRPPAFARLNQAREMLERRYPVPTIVWCDPHTYDTLRRHAPDFFDHFSGLVRFMVPRETSDGHSLQGMEFQQVDTASWGEDFGSGSAVRFYEEMLEHSSLSDEERVRALLGLAEGLAERSAMEGIEPLEKAAECAAQAVRILTPELDLAAWSRAHLLLARVLSPLGEREKALESAERALDGFRELGERSSAPVDEPVAKSLGSLSRCLAALGRQEDALDAGQEAVQIYRRLAERRPDAFLPNLARSLNNLSINLGTVGRSEDALAAIEEAVDIYRRLTEQRPHAFLPELAMSLTNLSIYLGDLERREDGLAASHEAVDIYRRLAEQRPDAFLPDFAGSLNNFSNRLGNLGRREDGLGAIQQAVGIYRRLAEQRPDAFLPDLAGSLNNLSVDLGNLGRHEDGLAASHEAVDIYRRLAEQRPDVFLPNLATSLSVLHDRLADEDQPAALTAIREALDHLEPFFRRHPPAFAPLMTTIIQDYERTAEACGEATDRPRLEAIRAILRQASKGD